jgi:hypothetical protein
LATSSHTGGLPPIGKWAKREKRTASEIFMDHTLKC